MMQTDDPVVAPQASYWRHARRLTAWLAAIWLIATFCVIFFARDLHHISLFGWPLSFYMAAQGILLIYVFLVGIYAWRMHRLDQRYARKDHEQ
jgi:putative solute:sodium symporter small subunit